MRQPVVLAFALFGSLRAAALQSPATGVKGESLATHDVNEKDSGHRDLVLMHVPYNFGHTVELAALLPHTLMPNMERGLTGSDPPANGFATSEFTWSMVEVAKLVKPSLMAWGHFNPDLNVVSTVTGCPMYYTPQKYWPTDLQSHYFGNKKVFGLLRDPFERLVSQFRGNFDAYGGLPPKFYETCDVNGAIKQLMKHLLRREDAFFSNCTFIPQADYFDGPYGIQIPVDNRRFPSSMNEVFAEHGYSEFIEAHQIGHVRGCDDVWAGDFDAETRSLVREYYKRDLELLCKHFGYCDQEENVCLQEVPHMCPETLFEWNLQVKKYFKREPGN